MRDSWPREPMLSAESIRQFRKLAEIVPLRLEFSSPYENIFESHLSLDTVTSHSGKNDSPSPRVRTVRATCLRLEFRASILMVARQDYFRTWGFTGKSPSLLWTAATIGWGETR